MAISLPEIEAALDAALLRAGERPAVLCAAMRWAVEGGGKRIRPQICLAAAEAVGGAAADAFERLPLLQDAELLRSILYSGVWQRYNRAAGHSSDQEENHEGPL